MSGKRILFASALCAAAVFGQTKSETFYFNHGDPKALKEYFNAIRAIGDIRDVTVDETKNSMTVSGTLEQVSIAAWLVNEFNQAPTSRPAMVRHDYPGALSQNQIVQVFFPAHLKTPQDLQEVVNMTRSIADIQRLFPTFASTAIAARGDASDMETAAWILSEVDQPVETLKPGGRDHTVKITDSRRVDNTAQVYVLTNINTPQALQELINGVRSVADIQRFFPFHSHKVVTIRASSDQVALADWMIKLLDQPAAAAPDTTTHEFHYTPQYSRDTGTIVRVVFLNHVESPQQLMQIVADVRTTTKIQRVFPNNQLHAILMRGDGDQISRAEQMIKELDQ
jgi:hypothetical protein